MGALNNFLSYLWKTVTLEFVFKFLVVYFFIVWISLVIWVMRDITIRTNNIFYQLFCILLLFFGSPLAVFIYLLIRPSKTLYERYYEEIEENLDIISELMAERRKEFEKNKQFETASLKPKKDILNMTDIPLKKEKPEKNTKQKPTKRVKTQIKAKKF